jgi:quercetin dioxygenase-like cupin family protein
MPTEPTPLRVDAPPDPVDRELEPLMGEPFASAWAADAAGRPAPCEALKDRLRKRLAASRAAARAMSTVRLKHLSAVELAPGVRARMLYEAPRDRALRPGEPLRARLIELQAGARWAGPDASQHREWLLLRGAARIGGERLQLRDYHVAPAGTAAQVLSSEAGAWLFLRESVLPSAAREAPVTVRDIDAGWLDFAPGIRRRVLWQHEGQAAMLYHAQAGAAVPHHSHGHDEECLMVQGELFLDDVLLQEGDYQLAPAGTGHRVTETDTGVVIYAHGDLDLKFVG